MVPFCFPVFNGLWEATSKDLGKREGDLFRGTATRRTDLLV